MKYVPTNKKIINYKSEAGGYYEAKCTICGGDYYPKSAKAVYCSTQCQQTAYVKRVKEKGEKVKAEEAQRLANEAQAKEVEAQRLKDATEAQEKEKQAKEAELAGPRQRLKERVQAKANAVPPLKTPVVKPKKVVKQVQTPLFPVQTPVVTAKKGVTKVEKPLQSPKMYLFEGNEYTENELIDEAQLQAGDDFTIETIGEAIEIIR